VIILEFKVHPSRWKKWIKQEAESWLKRREYRVDMYERLADYHAFHQARGEEVRKFARIVIIPQPFEYDQTEGIVVLEGRQDKEKQILSIRFYHGKQWERVNDND